MSEQNMTANKLLKALARFDPDRLSPDHDYQCSAVRGMEHDCHCGVLEIREVLKQIRKRYKP